MKSIRFENITKLYKNTKKPTIDNVNLELNCEGFIVFLGSSGCGKTTLLKMVNRLNEPSEGEVYIDGKNIKDFHVVQLRRSMGYVVQQTGLFPHMTVLENISVVPKMLKWEDDKILKRVNELLMLVNLDPDKYLNRFPRQLSGGQQQRVGIARAMAADPELLLMDEPFGAIDPITRIKLQDELLNLHRSLKKTILFVTHDVDEALKLADTIVIINEGKIVQQGSPLEIINRPVDDFVRDLIGCKDMLRKMSLIKVQDIMEKIKKMDKEIDIQASDKRIGKKYDKDIFKEDKNSFKNTVIIEPLDSLKQVLSKLIESGVDTLPIINDKDQYIGDINWDIIRKLGNSPSVN